MSDEYGRKGSLGNLTKILNRMVKLLEEQNALLKALVSKKKDEEDNYIEKSPQPYANKTGTRRG